MNIIAAIDIIEGKCVRLFQGDYKKKKIYHRDPLEMAKKFENNGIKYLHLVDLEGAKTKHIVNYKVLEKIANNTKLSIDFGGGIKSEQDIQIAFESGAKKISVGSLALKQPHTFIKWLSDYGNEKIILAADARKGKIAVTGWEENSKQDLIDFIEYYQKRGVKFVICTDIEKDGTLDGVSIAFYEKIIKKFTQKKEEKKNNTPLEIIASGGVKEMEDIRKLAEIGCSGVVIGKAIYENKITFKELENASFI